ncbi:MAG: hypothetical protein JSW49_05215 [candidate division WOR-3 bacterium]|nr:MAG: hypothetical protein JSW49_05215 [candidate division WOR-3 bacterium]
MFRYLLIVVCIVGLYGFVASESSEKVKIDGTGFMPGAMIMECHYQDEAWSGLMPEVVVTAPRFENEDDAWSGLMSEVTVTASGYASEDVDSSFAMSESRPQDSSVHQQPFNIDDNVIIILSILGLIILFIGLYMLPRRLRKAKVPANCVCCSK